MNMISKIARALGCDHSSTNARKIQDISGRGSMDTIRKHLATIRDEAQNACKEQENTDIPAPPQKTMDALWAAAHTFLERCARINEDRDRLRDALKVSTEDNEALVDEVDRLKAEAEKKASGMAQERADMREQETARAKALVSKWRREGAERAMNKRRKRKARERADAQIEG